MHRIRNLSIAAALFAAYWIVASLMSTPPATAQGSKPPTDVNVINQPSVNAIQSGAWNVGISGTPTVNVNNSAGAPMYVRDVDGPDAQPFQAVRLDGRNEGGCGANFCTHNLVTVPDGKRLIITNFHGAVALQPGSPPLAVAIENGDFETVFEIPRDGMTCFADTIKVGAPSRCPFNQDLRLVFEAEDSVRVDFSTTAGGDLSTAGWPQVFVVNGYYEDAAAPLMQGPSGPQPAVSSGARRGIQTP